ncbi:MAG TPA: beta-propeller fold lactonase family protein [Rhizomicrobium sp.]|nr:beta-propeller fold lactonase family protein [Rhizomicrobium sp.]
MLDRRAVIAMLGALPPAAFAPSAFAQDRTLPFYASVGPRLSLYALDVAAATLTPRGAVTLPANVQYAWPDPARRFLYVVASNTKPGGLGPDAGGHCAQAFRIGADGALSAHGRAVTLAHRPIHATVDHTGRFLLIAYNLPSSITVHRLNADGTIGEPVVQKHALDTGIYAHQVRVTPGNRTAALVTRGNDPRPGHPEDPGAIKVFAFEDGQLSNLQPLAPHGNGIGFGPRHLDFAPHHVAVSLERENALCIYDLKTDGTFGAEPLFIRNALADPGAKAKYPGQTAGPVHVHPNGRFVYQTNRGSGTVDYQGRKVWNGGENDIAVWSLNPQTGEPTRIQNIDSHGFEIRTFAIDPGGTLLIAASQLALPVHTGNRVEDVSAGLSLFRIGTDGKLAFLRKHDVDTSAGTQFWCGLLTMP